MYSSKEQIQTYFGITITDDISYIINGIDQYIDNYTRRHFIADLVASIKYYDGKGFADLLADDNIEVTKVEYNANNLGNSDTWYEITEDCYHTFPYNILNSDDEAIRPIWQITWLSSCFACGRKNLRVTAKWGYSLNVPDDIAWVSTFLSGAIYLQGKNKIGSGVKSEKIGNYSITLQDSKTKEDFTRAMTILNKYKKPII